MEIKHKDAPFGKRNILAVDSKKNLPIYDIFKNNKYSSPLCSGTNIGVGGPKIIHPYRWTATITSVKQAKILAEEIEYKFKNIKVTLTLDR